MRHPLEGVKEGETGDLDPEMLGPEFTEDIHFLRSKILNDTPVKQIWSRKVTGKIMAFLLTEYVSGLNK